MTSESSDKSLIICEWDSLNQLDAWCSCIHIILSTDQPFSYSHKSSFWELLWGVICLTSAVTLVMGVLEAACMVGYELKGQCSCNLGSLYASVWQARNKQLCFRLPPQTFTFKVPQVGLQLRWPITAVCLSHSSFSLPAAQSG